MNKSLMNKNTGAIKKESFFHGNALIRKSKSNSPAMAFNMNVYAGSIYDKNVEGSDYGMAHLVEHLVATSYSPENKLRENNAEMNGMPINAWTSAVHTVYQQNGVKKLFRYDFDVLSDIINIFKENLDVLINGTDEQIQERLEQEIPIILSELQTDEMERVNSFLYMKVMQEYYTNPNPSNKMVESHTFGHTAGYRDSIQNITPQGVRNFVRRYYNKNNVFMNIIFDGDSKDVKRLKDLIDSFYEVLPKGGRHRFDMRPKFPNNNRLKPIMFKNPEGVTNSVHLTTFSNDIKLFDKVVTKYREREIKSFMIKYPGYTKDMVTRIFALNMLDVYINIMTDSIFDHLRGKKNLVYSPYFTGSDTEFTFMTFIPDKEGVNLTEEFEQFFITFLCDDADIKRYYSKTINERLNEFNLDEKILHGKTSLFTGDRKPNIIHYESGKWNKDLDPLFIPKIINDLDMNEMVSPEMIDDLHQSLKKVYRRTAISFMNVNK